MPETPDPLVPPLFSPLQIGVASFIGGPVTACWFFARNFRALGQPRRARHTLALGIAGMIALGVLSYYLPASFPRPAIPIGYTLGLYYTAQVIHGAIVREHVARGGAAGSWRQVIGFSLGFLAFILLLLLALSSLAPIES